MQPRGCDVRIDRDVAYGVLTELLELRSLIGRFGGDLRDVAARSRRLTAVKTRSSGDRGR